MVMGAAVLMSLAIHLALAGWVVEAKRAQPEKVVVRMKVVEPPPLAPEPPPPPPPPPEPLDLTRPPETFVPTVSAPPDAPPPTQPVRPVFGVSMQSTVSSGQGAFTVAVGNTIGKEPDKDRPPPDQVQALPPVDYRRVETSPVRIQDWKAPYPSTERDAGIEGVTVLKLTLSEDGRVTEAKVLRGPSPVLNEEARKAMFKLRFKPGTVDGRPVPVTGLIYEYEWIIER